MECWGRKARERVPRKLALIRRLLHSAHPVFDFLCGRLRPVDGWSGVCISDPSKTRILVFKKRSSKSEVDSEKKKMQVGRVDKVRGNEIRWNNKRAKEVQETNQPSLGMASVY
jgi:hypothetical protein